MTSEFRHRVWYEITRRALVRTQTFAKAAHPLSTVVIKYGAGRKILTIAPIPQWKEFRQKFLDLESDPDLHQNQVVMWLFFATETSAFKKFHSNSSTTFGVMNNIRTIANISLWT